MILKIGLIQCRKTSPGALGSLLARLSPLLHARLALQGLQLPPGSVRAVLLDVRLAPRGLNPLLHRQVLLRFLHQLTMKTVRNSPRKGLIQCKLRLGERFPAPALLKKIMVPLRRKAIMRRANPRANPREKARKKTLEKERIHASLGGLILGGMTAVMIAIGTQAVIHIAPRMDQVVESNGISRIFPRRKAQCRRRQLSMALAPLP
jgi:hypothetical protein